MSSIRKYYRLFTWIFLISTHSLYSKNNIILSKGRIELLTNVVDLTYIKNHTPLRDSLFSCANNALTELELHLSYKLSEPIRMSIFSSISDFAKHQQNKNSKYLGVLMCGNTKDISYQIRYNVASLFIDEYLMGLSVRERLERIKLDRIPNWLKTGFIQYFAQGITYKDFELFRKWSQDGRFRNINFIPENEQEIFGSVIWYLFEKEKGRTIDGAFWMLIKNANSFEKSFSYQFDVRFNSWLKNKIDEIKLQENADILTDYKFKISQQSLTSLKPLHFTDTNSLVVYSLISNSERSDLVKLTANNQKIEKIISYNTVCFNQHLVFSMPTFQFKGIGISSRYAMSWENNVWNLSLDSQIIYTPPNQGGIWKIVNSNEDELILTHEIYDYTDVYSISISSKEGLKICRINSDKITQWVRSDSALIYSGTSYSWNHLLSKSYLAKVQNSISVKDVKIWESSIGRWLVDLSSIVLESDNHLSFVKEQETKSELIHLFKTIDKSYSVTATSTKGDFYGQIKTNDESRRQVEFYLLKNHMVINLNYSDEIILISDTVKIRKYTFDSTQLDSSLRKKFNQYSEGNLFLSDFEKENTPEFQKFSPIIQKEEFKFAKFKNWFYAKNSTFYLSNKDIELGYSRSIPTTELYNSPLTLFYNGKFFNNQGTDQLLLELFSNFNRRRVGISASYLSENSKWSQGFTFMYRQRQFRNAISNLNQREQSFQISHCIALKNKTTAPFTPYLNSRGQWISDISMNYLPEFSRSEIKRDLLLELEFGLKFNSIKWKNKPSFLNINSDFMIQNGLFSGNYIAGTILNSEIGIKTRYFDIQHKSSAKYSFTHANHLFVLGGTKGWINSDANTNNISNQLEADYSGLVYVGGYVRGTQLGSRMGNSYISSQSEIHYKPLKLVKSYILGSSFWKQLSLFGFYDFSTGFVGGNTRHFKNPYNTLIYQYPNYTIRAGANRNPWISSCGFGVQMRALGTDFRIEFPQSTVGDEPPKRSVLISLGKNF